MRLWDLFGLLCRLKNTVGLSHAPGITGLRTVSAVARNTRSESKTNRQRQHNTQTRHSFYSRDVMTSRVSGGTEPAHILTYRFEVVLQFSPRSRSPLRIRHCNEIHTTRRHTPGAIDARIHCAVLVDTLERGRATSATSPVARP